MAASAPSGVDAALVDYLVYSRDADGVEEEMAALTPAHWDYMDRFADRLVARGPTLTADGDRHTGSVHVVSLSDAAAARRFAAEEPYQQAGLFAETTIRRFMDLLGGTMWDRPPSPTWRESTLVLARWPEVVVDRPFVARPSAWVFLGVLVTDDGARSIGVVGTADASAADAERMVRELRLPVAAVEVHRWERGGRR